MLCRTRPESRLESLCGVDGDETAGREDAEAVAEALGLLHGVGREEHRAMALVVVDDLE